MDLELDRHGGLAGIRVMKNRRDQWVYKDPYQRPTGWKV
jgi:hypothetical protein